MMEKKPNPLQALMNERRAAAPTPVNRPVEPGLELLLKQYQLMQAELAEKDAKLAALQHTTQHTAGPDAATGLANRQALEDELTKSLATAQRYGRVHGLVVLELTDFNVLAGLESGAAQAMLTHVARLLRQNIRPTDIAARPEPEAGAPQRFFVILNELRELENLTMRAGALAAVVQTTPCLLWARTLPLSVQVGCTMFGAGDALGAVLAAAVAKLAGAGAGRA
jgi:GGDEF domain-containing protein